VPRLINKITTGYYKMKDPIWDKVSKEAKKLINAMLHLDPAKRLNAT